MAPVNPRVVKAFQAMRDIGIPEAKVRPILKKLLSVYDRNWDLIEGENYRVLADAIFEEEPLDEFSRKEDENAEASSSKKKKKSISEQEDTPEKEKAVLLGERTGPPAKRLRLKYQGLDGGSLRLPKDEPIDDCPDYPPLAVVYPNEEDCERSQQLMQTERNADRRCQLQKENGTETLAIRNAHRRCQLHVASTPLGEVNISLSCDKMGFCMPSLDAVMKMAEDRCPRSYKILDPSFSVKKLLEHMCEGFLELAAQERQDFVQVLPRTDILKRTPGIHDLSDISKGQESVVIPVERGNQEFLPSFSYISQNAVFRRASVDFSLCAMGDDHCSSCFGDCLSSDVPCVCACETGGEFAYTVEGLVKEKLLDEFISLKRNPQDHSFCKECPLERSKNGDMMEPCKGHLVRTFIKECWLKCGCNKKYCGNRVVQRGISYKLQVFESQGKGWGVRALEDLPKGAFVCEYAGEVLTNAELFERSPKGEEGHSYPVLLDAGWGSERILKDEQALCLDGSRFGNVARFINHRCCDANLIEIPVKIENPDHHYYHVAFFTTREVKATKELTWDYGIDFDNVEHPFQCLCGSQFCRNIRRQSLS